MMLINEINQKLRQRPPFQMIERVTEIDPGERAVGIKNVSINEPWFQGHFPDSPIMPGVLIEEACAQLCSIAMDDGSAADADSNVLYVLLKVNQFKFVKTVIPGDQMVIEVKKTMQGGPLVTFDATVKVDGNVHAKGSLTFTAVDKDTVYSRG